MRNYNLLIASDHAGFDLKMKILDFLRNYGYEIHQNNGENISSKKKSIIDLGTHSTVSVDYTDYAQKVVLGIVQKNAEYGILICDTGIGMSIAANRNTTIRAALCLNEFMAERARSHNNANILVLGAKLTEEKLALQIVDKFLNTEFEGGRHEQRVNKLS